MSSLYPHTYDAVARIYSDKEDRLWVSHQELLNYYIGLEDFTIVYLNNKFYELQAYVEKPDAWWLEEVNANEI